MAQKSITITRPDDWHLHLRDGIEMADVLQCSAARFGRALIMPNLDPPIVTFYQAKAYRQRIQSALPERSDFNPLMTLYLTDDMPTREINYAKKSGFIKAMKLYPAGATTNSSAGVTDIKKVYPVLARMEEVGMVLCVHGEATDPEIDVFDREEVFLKKILTPIANRFTGLKIVVEHVTTEIGVGAIESFWPNVFATITAHHLLLNRNALFNDGLHPHNYCLPILKRERDRQALLQAATSGNPKFFLGTDSAPHSRGAKESGRGCAGCFTAHASIELYAEAFDSVGKLDMLEGFASHFGADFYGLPRNRDMITLVNEPWRVPETHTFGENVVVRFRTGEMVKWKMK